LKDTYNALIGALYIGHYDPDVVGIYKGKKFVRFYVIQENGSLNYWFTKRLQINSLEYAQYLIRNI